MQQHRSLTLALLIAVSLSTVSGCATTGSTPGPFPPASDLKRESKPSLSPADLESDAALDAHDAAIEAWGERGWATVDRLCRFFDRMGMKGLECPAQINPDDD